MPLSRDLGGFNRAGSPPDAVEEVLEVYHTPQDPAGPVVCVDETSKQLIAETRVPNPAEPDRTARYGYQYERNGTAIRFMMRAPLQDWRKVKVTDRRTALDYARILKDPAARISPTPRKSSARGGQSQHAQSGVT